MNVSKELVREVLNVEAKDVYTIGDRINYDVGPLTTYSINVYELAFKVKEWVNKFGYIIASQTYNGIYRATLTKDIPNPKRAHRAHIVSDVSEVDAIFKAGEWVLKHLKRRKHENI